MIICRICKRELTNKDLIIEKTKLKSDEYYHTIRCSYGHILATFISNRRHSNNEITKNLNKLIKLCQSRWERNIYTTLKVE